MKSTTTISLLFFYSDFVIMRMAYFDKGLQLGFKIVLKFEIQICVFVFVFRLLPNKCILELDISNI